MNLGTNHAFRKWPGKILAIVMEVALIASYLPAQQDADYTFHAETEIVLVNVSVRDKNGKFVDDLKPEDFKVTEDGKAQKILSFDVENTDAIPSFATSQPSTALAQLATKQTTAATPAAPAKTPAPATSTDAQFKDHRLIVLFFDLSAMQPDEIDRSAQAAENYVDKQMQPADLVAVVSLGNDLEVSQDFTSDKQQLKKVLSAFNEGSGQGFEEGTTGTTEGTQDVGQSFTADDTEYNIFNTDRRLEAIRSVAEKLAHVQQKKSLIYFSSGMDRTGLENQSELRAATNAAVRANLSIYTMDIRGLQAIVPGGEAQSASMRGTSPYSGQATLNAFNSNFSSQETLVTLAADTGGRAFLDSNDFSRIFKGVQDDTARYYLIGYHSTNSSRDGKYRHISVSIERPGVKLVYRKGYYAPADFKHSNQDNRERQLQEEFASELPSTDLPVYLSAGYFRLSEGKFFVPISIVVPGSEIPFINKSNQDKATLDILGGVEDDKKHPVDEIRDTVKLAVNTSTDVKRKNVQYNNEFYLPPGQYHVKFVVRENETGRMGSFEADITVPDLKNQPLKMSSVILANQIQPAAKRKINNDPLVRNGSEIIPNVTHVFSSGQHLYFYYEVYDPVQADGSKSKNDVRLLSNVAFFQGKIKSYETPLVETKSVAAQDRKAAIFQLDVPLSQLKPGFYTCQVNVVDDAAGKFLFPRLALLVRK